jgi:hypothetical protein
MEEGSKGKATGNGGLFVYDPKIAFAPYLI